MSPGGRLAAWLASIAAMEIPPKTRHGLSCFGGYTHRRDTWAFLLYIEDQTRDVVSLQPSRCAGRLHHTSLRITKHERGKGKYRPSKRLPKCCIRREPHRP